MFRPMYKIIICINKIKRKIRNKENNNMKNYIPLKDVSDVSFMFLNRTKLYMKNYIELW